MDNDGEPRIAILAFVAATVLIGSAIGLFLLIAGEPGTSNSPADTTTQQQTEPRDTAPGSGSEPSAQDANDQPRRTRSLLEILGLTPSREPPKCTDVDACREPSPELLARYPDATSCDWYERRVCIVPLGDVPVELVKHLVDYYATEYELEVRVLRPITLDEGLDTERPGQVEADALRQYFSTQYFVYDRDLDAILIGLTPLDIYTAERPEWRWFFGQTYGYLDEPLPNQAIISFFRMEPVNWGEPEDVDLRNRRVRTLMNKYVALTYYGLQLNDDPESVLYRLIGSLGALDRIDERIPLEP